MNRERFNKFGLPSYMWDGLERWVVSGIVPGSFLTAVLKNDLRGACEFADDLNTVCLSNWVKFLYSNAPIGCWGSEKAFKRWESQKAQERIQDGKA